MHTQTQTKVSPSLSLTPGSEPSNSTCVMPIHLPLRSLLEMRSVAFSDCSERFFSRSKTSRGLVESCTGQSRDHRGATLNPSTPQLSFHDPATCITDLTSTREKNSRSLQKVDMIFVFRLRYPSPVFHVCIYVWCLYMYTFTWAHMHVEAPRLISGIILNHLPY